MAASLPCGAPTTTGRQQRRVYAQRYDDAGAAVGSESGSTKPPPVAITSRRHRLLWRRSPSPGTTNDNYDSSGSGSYADVYVRASSAPTAALTGQIKANTRLPASPASNEPAIAVLAGDGSFVVTWRTDATQDGDGTGVYAQHFAANGAWLGG